MKTQIQSFTDLIVWQKAHPLVVKVYKITLKYPESELYGLSNQMRRSAVSVVSNIAEGFSRRTTKDKERFYHIALGSLTELQAQLLISRDLNYLNKTELTLLAETSTEVSKLLNGLIKANQKKS